MNDDVEFHKRERAVAERQRDEAYAYAEGHIKRLEDASRREAELHYAIRNTANILDHNLSEEDAHAMALRIVEKMHDLWQAAHDVDEAFSRDAPMMLVDTGAVAERKLERMRVVLDRPVSGPTA
jgi:hypothetical protein